MSRLSDMKKELYGKADVKLPVRIKAGVPRGQVIIMHDRIYADSMETLRKAAREEDWD